MTANFTEGFKGTCPIYDEILEIDITYKRYDIMGCKNIFYTKICFSCEYSNDSDQCASCPIYENAPLTIE